ncbi:MAG: NAD(P)/FAD-dependent oxidoreductase [Chitinophagaceae bacterium]|nr:NAD(P)/FAD-dependent oxidoreductase [Chitinophagaceae bacterium]MCW5928937.1 NAD(P)/FAD-dependent oxidoreductase [Chitinophagaceae bacterium]
MKKRKAIIIGAGPAGLTAAYELLTKTDIIPIIIEQDNQVGGLSKTIDFEGNKIDIGGHRFFSRSKKVVDWWLHFLPLENSPGKPFSIRYQNQSAGVSSGEQSPVSEDAVMLLRPRKSRIYHARKFFDYPLQINGNTLRNLGLAKLFAIGTSYCRAKLLPKKPERTLEDFFINRFGNKLYTTFFKDYTEKVWGVPCNELPADWGRQRVKGLDVGNVIKHAFRSIFLKDRDIRQAKTKTSLIEQFLYPKFGPGQMWETVAGEIQKRGGEIILNTGVTKITRDHKHIISVETTNFENGQSATCEGDLFFSAMPVKELVEKMDFPEKDHPVVAAARSLEYRDFLIVGILSDKENGQQDVISDNWIYIQEGDIKAGRVQFFHNWSPGMTKDSRHHWIGVEYFCNETDEFWQQEDEAISSFAVSEMDKIGIVDSRTVLKTTVIKVKKAYPSYFGGYSNFGVIQEFLNGIDNLYPVGRNGMHRYNNTDHSMLTAMAAVDNIVQGKTDKSAIWAINTEDAYHEQSDN